MTEILCISGLMFRLMGFREVIELILTPETDVL